MKTLKLLSMIVFALCLVSTVSAIAVYGDWEDESQTMSITIGDSVDFNVDFISINPPMTINVKLYDSASNLVYSFEDGLSVNDYSYFATYTIDSSDSSVYSIGYYELIISGSDTVNSDSETLYLTINEIPDTNIPVITLLGDNPVTVVQGTTYTDAGATAYDVEDGDITANILVTGSVDTNTLGTYVLTYNVQDNAGNFAAPVTRTVSVVEEIIPDTTAPVITLLGNALENVALGTSYVDAGATALDDVDGDITANIVVINPVDTDTIGIYTITYNVQDNAGNSPLEVIRTVNVFDPNDTIAPTITVITPEQDKEYDDSELTFEVEVDEIAEVTFSLNGGSEITMDYAGISGGSLTFVYDLDLDDGDYEVTFYATDAAGNTASETVEFSVDTEEGDKENDKTYTNYYQTNYEEELYLNQFKNPRIIYLEDEDYQPEKVLNWWQKFIEWLKNLFGF